MNTALQICLAIVWANLVEWLGHRRLHDTHDVMHIRHHDKPHPVNGLLIGHPLLLLLVVTHVGLAFYYGYPTMGLTWALYMCVLEGWHYWAHGHPTAIMSRWHIQHHRSGEGHYNVFLPLWDWLLGTRIQGE